MSLDDSNIQVSPTGGPLKIISNRFSTSAYRQSNEPDQIKLKKEQQQVYWAKKVLNRFSDFREWGQRIHMFKESFIDCRQGVKTCLDSWVCLQVWSKTACLGRYLGAAAIFRRGSCSNPKDVGLNFLMLSPCTETLCTSWREDERYRTGYLNWVWVSQKLQSNNFCTDL